MEPASRWMAGTKVVVAASLLVGCDTASNGESTMEETAPDDPDGSTIQPAVTYLAGSDPGVSDNPLIVLGGGPGEVMVETFLTGPFARQLFDVGPDLIILDQRGVGSSRPSLVCDEIDDLDVQDSMAEDIDAALEATGACRDRLIDDGTDLNGFNHIANAGHGPLESLDACGRQIAAEFLGDPTSPPDDSCAAEARLIIMPELPGCG